MIENIFTQISEILHFSGRFFDTKLNLKNQNIDQLNETSAA